MTTVRHDKMLVNYVGIFLTTWAKQWNLCDTFSLIKYWLGPIDPISVLSLSDVFAISFLETQGGSHNT